MDTTDPPSTEPSADTPPDEVPILGAGLKLDDPNGPLAPYYASNAGIVIALLLGALAALYGLQPLWNTDIWGHVAYGRYIAEHGLPKTEPLSPFTDHDQPFGPYSWLAQRGYYALVQLGQKLHPKSELAGLQAGAELIRFVHWLAQMGTFVFLWLACRRCSGPIAANVAIVFLLLCIPTMLGIQRPQAFGAFFFAIMLWLWSGPPRSHRANIFIVLLFALWANIHGSFAVALVFQGLHLLGNSLQAWRETGDVKSVLRRNEFRTRTVVMVACFLATFANPRGVLLYQDMLALGSHPNVRSMVEWQGIEAQQTGLWLATLASAGVILACQLIARRLHLTTVLLFVVFLAWGYSQQRMFLWWFLLFPWLACLYFADVYQKLGFKPSATTMGAGPELNFRKTFIAVGFVVVGSVIPWLDLVQNRLKQDPERTFSSGTCWALALELNADGAQRGTYLPELAKVLRTYPDGRLKGPIFATETQGDFLLFTQPADRPTMMFSHAHSFGVDYWNRCREVKAGDPHWAYTLRKYKVNLVVAEPMFNIGLTNLLKNDPEWVIVLDEEGNEKISDERGRKVIAVRKKPVE